MKGTCGTIGSFDLHLAQAFCFWPSLLPNKKQTFSDLGRDPLMSLIYKWHPRPSGSASDPQH